MHNEFEYIIFKLASIILNTTVLLITFFLLSLYSQTVFAHPGNTDSSGCHTCRTNCPSWGLSYGEYHCHTPKYTPPPSCPLFSSYNSITSQCECYSGYVASGNSCISGDQACKNQYGYNSQHEYSTGKCTCTYGYVWNETATKCISADESCQNSFGYNSKASLSANKCECRYGYIFNKAGTKCIAQNDACQEIVGLMSTYDPINNTCKCVYGYEMISGQCSPEKKEIITPIPITITTEPEPVEKETNTEVITRPYIQPTIIATPIVVNNEYGFPFKLKSELKVGSKGEEVKILQSALLTMKEIYPDGTVSGYYGELTNKAVERFQEKFNLNKTGRIDKSTLEKFNTIFTTIEATPTPDAKSLQKPNISFIDKILQFFGFKK